MVSIGLGGRAGIVLAKAIVVTAPMVVGVPEYGP